MKLWAAGFRKNISLVNINGVLYIRATSANVTKEFLLDDDCVKSLIELIESSKQDMSLGRPLPRVVRNAHQVPLSFYFESLKFGLVYLSFSPEWIDVGMHRTDAITRIQTISKLQEILQSHIR